MTSLIAAKLAFVDREKRIFVGAAKLILWVDVRGEEVAFSRKKGLLFPAEFISLGEKVIGGED